jgi:hypothetical protein
MIRKESEERNLAAAAVAAASVCQCLVSTKIPNTALLFGFTQLFDVKKGDICHVGKDYGLVWLCIGW